MLHKNLTLIFLMAFAISSCVSDNNTNKDNKEAVPGEVNVYTHRHYDIDKQIFADFEKETGIKVNVIEDDADKLILRMESEGKKSPCDLLITTDVARLIKAKDKQLLQPVIFNELSSVPAYLKDKENYWTALTYRTRFIVYAKDRVKPEELSTYEDLANTKWKKKILVRSSDNVYNQSLMAAIVYHLGYDGAMEWAKGLVKNFAREPKGNDREQVIAIYAGEGDIAIVNSYYLGKLKESTNPEEVKAFESVNVFFPNQANRGAHINISGAGVALNAPHKDNAIKLLQYLLSDKVQKIYAEANYEYPVKQGIAHNELLQSWGSFKADTMALENIGKYQLDALKIFSESGWK
jgi:iron(III) transport system substrate-binding protein